MLSVIVIWIYMLLSMFLIGYGILSAVAKLAPYRFKHMDSYIVCGLAGVTVYAQFYSLFGRVGLWANLLLCVLCAAGAWCSRRTLGAWLRKWRDGIREKQSGERGKMLGILFLFFLFAYGASRGIIHYDTSLYHAQSIRWIEEYGVVKGLGNLHCRLAYNSSSFALSALYSMAFLGGQSYHCAAGLLAFLLAKVCLEVTEALRIRRLRVGDFARVMGIYYLVNIFDEMVSPASDYFMVLLAFYIVIRWLDLAEEKTEEITLYAMLCVLGVFLMTVKLSAALILLLALYPAYYLLCGKRWKEIGVYLTLGVTAALPFFIRNVVLSGWLVYPFTQIDLFKAAWKIPKGIADYDAREIQVWGRGYTDVSGYDISMREWMPGWFGSLAGSDKLLVIAAAAAVIVLFVYTAGALCRLWSARWEVLTVQITVAASFLFWLCTSPLIRYGCVYVYLTPAVIFGGVYDAMVSGGETEAGRRRRSWEKRRILKQKTMDAGAGSAEEESGANDTGAGSEERFGIKVVRLCGLAAAFLLIAYKAFALGREMIGTYVNDYWITQKDYENYGTLSYEVGGVTIYYPAEGDRVGYDAFPSAPAKTEVELLGKGIGEGCRSPFRVTQ